jgi:transaldolase
MWQYLTLLGGTLNFKIKMFADGADIEEIRKLRQNPKVSGFTTNPTLLAKSGVLDYPAFAKEAAKIAHPHPISFEVISDDLDEMYEQAKKIYTWGQNVYVKIPVTNTKGTSTGSLISQLAKEGVALNVTALMTIKQVNEVCSNLKSDVPSVVSVFAGRIADAGIDPIPVMNESLVVTSKLEKCELLWASPREILNIIQAEKVGCQIITMTSDLWKKTANLGINLEEFSLSTVKMFYNDAINSNLKI